MPDPLRQTVSATEVAALFNVSPYMTRWTLYQRFKHPELPDQKGDNRMDWGTRLEPLVLQAAAEDLRFTVIPNGGREYVRNGLVGCTRDAIIICPDRGPGALETKCVFDYKVLMRDWGGGDKPPRYHETQLQTQMKVGLERKPFKWGVLAMWCAGEMKYFEREPLPELWESIDAETRKFFDDIANSNEPPAFGTALELPIISKLYPPQKGKVLDLSTETTEEGQIAALKIAEAVRMWEWHKKEKSGHERAEKELQAQIRGVMLDHEELRLPKGVNAKQKLVNRKGYSVEPTSYVTLSAHVPDEANDGALEF